MNDTQAIPLNEDIWREWVDKGRAREKHRARRRAKTSAILLVLLVVALAATYFLADTSALVTV